MSSYYTAAQLEAMRKEKIKKELQILENRYNEIISQYEVK